METKRMLFNQLLAKVRELISEGETVSMVFRGDTFRILSVDRKLGRIKFYDTGKTLPLNKDGIFIWKTDRFLVPISGSLLGDVREFDVWPIFNGSPEFACTLFRSSTGTHIADSIKVLVAYLVESLKSANPHPSRVVTIDKKLYDDNFVSIKSAAKTLSVNEDIVLNGAADWKKKKELGLPFIERTQGNVLLYDVIDYVNTVKVTTEEAKALPEKEVATRVDASKTSIGAFALEQKESIAMKRISEVVKEVGCPYHKVHGMVASGKVKCASKKVVKGRNIYYLDADAVDAVKAELAKGNRKGGLRPDPELTTLNQLAKEIKIDYYHVRKAAVTLGVCPTREDTQGKRTVAYYNKDTIDMIKSAVLLTTWKPKTSQSDDPSPRPTMVPTMKYVKLPWHGHRSPSPIVKSARKLVVDMGETFSSFSKKCKLSDVCVRSILLGMNAPQEKTIRKIGIGVAILKKERECLENMADTTTPLNMKKPIIQPQTPDTPAYGDTVTDLPKPIRSRSKDPIASQEYEPIDLQIVMYGVVGGVSACSAIIDEKIAVLTNTLKASPNKENLSKAIESFRRDIRKIVENLNKLV